MISVYTKDLELKAQSKPQEFVKRLKENIKIDKTTNTIKHVDLGYKGDRNDEDPTEIAVNMASNEIAMLSELQEGKFYSSELSDEEVSKRIQVVFDSVKWSFQAATKNHNNGTTIIKEKIDDLMPTTSENQRRFMEQFQAEFLRKQSSAPTGRFFMEDSVEQLVRRIDTDRQNMLSIESIPRFIGSQLKKRVDVLLDAIK